MPAKAKKKSLRSSKKLDRKAALVFAAVFAIVGGAVILRSFAVTSHGSPVLYLSPASQTVTVGATFNMQIRVLNQNNSDTSQSNVAAYVNYPANILSVNSISYDGSTFPSSPYDGFDNSSGELYSESYGSLNLPPDDFLVATVNFTAKATGDAPVILQNYSHYDVYGPPELQNADYTISNPAPPPSGGTGLSGSNGSSSGSKSSSGSSTTLKTPAAASGSSSSTPAPATTLQGTPSGQNTKVTTLPTTDSTNSATTKTAAVAAKPQKNTGRLIGEALVGLAAVLGLAGFGLVNAKKHRPAAAHPVPIHPAPVHPAPPVIKPPPPKLPPMPAFIVPPPSRNPYGWVPKLRKARKGPHHAGAAADDYVEPEDMFAEGQKRLTQEGIAGKPPRRPQK